MSDRPDETPDELPLPFRRIRPTDPAYDRPPTTEELVRLPSTEGCLADQARAGAAERAEPEDSGRRQMLLERAAAATRTYRWALRRDAELEKRRALGPEYADCFCLGQGGGGSVVGVSLPDANNALAHTDDGKPVEIWNERCPCPDGRAMFARALAAADATRARLRAGRVRAILGEAGIPTAYAGRTREGWLGAVEAQGGDAKAARALLGWIEHWEALVGGELPVEQCVLRLSGNLGTGKSTLAALVARAWAEQGREVLFRSMPQLAGALRAASWQRRDPEDPPTEEELLAALETAPMLVLDDLGTEILGTEAQQERAREWLFRVLDARIQNGLATVVTTNFTTRELTERYGERIAARLASRGYTVDIPLGDDRIPNLRGSID